MQSQTLFVNYIIAGLEASLARVDAAQYTLPEADRQQAWHLLSFALKLVDPWPVTRKLLIALAPKMEAAGFRTEWLPYLQKGLHCAEQRGDRHTIASCELQIGRLYRLLSHFEEAYRWTAASVEHFATVDAQAQAAALNELAWLVHLQHHYDQAAAAVAQALQLLPAQDPERAMSYRVLGMIAIYQMKYQEAETYHRSALALLTEEDATPRAWCLQNLALSLRYQERHDEAIPLFTQAAKILDRAGDVSNWGITQMNLGSAYYYAGETENALSYFDDARKVADRLQDKVQIARIYTYLGLAYLALHRFDDAEAAFQLAIGAYAALGDEGWRLNAVDGLAMVYLSSKQYAKAVALLDEAIAALPTIAHLPNYAYLHQSLHEHRAAAIQG